MTQAYSDFNVPDMRGCITQQAFAQVPTGTAMYSNCGNHDSGKTGGQISPKRWSLEITTTAIVNMTRTEIEFFRELPVRDNKLMDTH